MQERYSSAGYRAGAGCREAGADNDGAAGGSCEGAADRERRGGAVGRVVAGSAGRWGAGGGYHGACSFRRPRRDTRLQNSSR